MAYSPSVSNRELLPTHKKAWIGFFVAHGLITRAIDDRLKMAGMVPMDVYDVLLHLEVAPEQRLRLSELADRALLTRSGMTRMVDRLVKQGLVQRKACPLDGRVQYAVITERGLVERERAWEVYRQGIVEFFAGRLTEEEATSLAGCFCRVIREVAPGYSLLQA
jgi:DNA-binding MarR family transcriptional regulator